MSDTRIKIFCDFDGTITLHDAWLDLGEEFIADKTAWRKVIGEFESLQIGARECFLNELSLIERFDKKIFDNIIDKQKFEQGFFEFVEYCKENSIPLTILSEGMDYYIERILKKHNLDIPFYANHLIISEDEKNISLSFPHSDSDCTRCGTSKRNLLMNLTDDDEVSVYIGDGFSDACVVHYADIVFAKKSLASYCWKNNISYFDFETFHDIIRKMEKIISQKKIKHRQEAKLKRRSVFLRG